MKKHLSILFPTAALTLALCAALPPAATAQDEKTKDDEIISSVMKLCNKAPKGTPKLAEKVADGSASEEETKKLIESYKTLKGTKPPKGEKRFPVPPCVLGDVFRTVATDRLTHRSCATRGPRRFPARTRS